MEHYDKLALWYDRLQQSLDHKAWALFIKSLNDIYGTGDEGGEGEDGKPLMLDLGCGTGKLTLEMEALGFDVIGIDNSSVMLQIAKERAEKAGSRALFLHQDISDFELYGTIDLAICMLDTINHLIRIDDIKNFFRLCANYLNQNSLLILDIATLKHFDKTLGNNVFFQDLPSENDDKAITMLWQNSWNKSKQISYSDITLFIQTENDLYKRYEEYIIERYYPWEKIKQLAEDSGLEFVVRTSDLKITLPKNSEERNFMVFRQPAKKLMQVK